MHFKARNTKIFQQNIVSREGPISDTRWQSVPKNNQALKRSPSVHKDMEQSRSNDQETQIKNALR